MRTVVGGLVGLVIAVALIGGVGVWSTSEPWPVVVAGILAGLVMRAVASGEGSQYARGGFAGIVTAAAAVLGPLVATQVIQSEYTVTSGGSKPAAAKVAPAAEEAPAEGEETVVAEVTPEPVKVAPSPVVNRGPSAPTAARDPFQPLPVAMLVVGCLMAYQIGKGVDPVMPQEEEAPAEEGGDPPATEAAGEGEAAESEQPAAS